MKAVIFDMDGILIDSEPLWRQAEIKVFRTVGIELTEEDCIQTLGYRIDEVEDYWYNRQPWQNREKGQVAEAIVDEMVFQIKAQGKAMIGVEDALELFTNLGYKIGLASSSSMRLIDTVLDTLKIRSFFHAIHSAEHEAYGKPHPAVFISCMRSLDIQAENCLIIEDSPSGIIAARASKARVIAVPEPHNRNKPEMGIAHAQLDSLAFLEGSLIASLF